MLTLVRFLFGLFAVITLGAWIAHADDDEYEREHYRDRKIERRSVAAPTNTIYRAECGSCHMVYPPGLLTERSWLKIMSGLKDHFGDNATLEQEVADKVKDFLTENAADKSSFRRSRKIARSIPKEQSPLRFTETNYFKRQHHEVSQKIWSRASIGSRSNCVACHQRAEQGIFSEDEIRIPR